MHATKNDCMFDVPMKDESSAGVASYLQQKERATNVLGFFFFFCFKMLRSFDVQG